MPSTNVAETFLTLIERSNLLSAEAVSKKSAELGLDAVESEKEIARVLVERGVLTRWQAARLLDGRYHGFFIDEYMLLEILGAGGMGRLYLAARRPDGERFAVKVLAEQHKEDKGMLTRLQFEAEAGMRLNHPNIVRTIKLDKTADVRELPYIVMQFVEGVSLDELVIASGKCGWEQACDFICQAARGLEHAHKARLIHRDIKPANLVVDREGGLRILDFGLALIEGEDESEFSLKMIFGHDCVGTADYMPPEQAADSSTVDCRADIFSLGCTFYSILSGELPFGRTSAKRAADGSLELKRSRRPPSLRAADPEIPREVEAVIARMMSPDAEMRFKSAGEVARALEPFARRQPVEFNFAEVLEKRRLRAEKRLAVLERARSSARSISTAAGYDQDTKPYRKAEPLAPAPEDVEAPEKKPRPAIAHLPSTAELVRTKLEESRPDHPSGGALTGGTTPALAEPTAFLVPLDGGEPIPLRKQRIVIGRKEHCDVQIGSPLVSGEHCELLHEGHWWTIRDLDSKNGIRINGTPATEESLWPGSRLTIAEQYHFLVNDRPDEKTSGSWRKPLLYAGLGLLAAVIAGLIWWLSR